MCYNEFNSRARRPMQGSSNYKIHEKGNKSSRNDKGRHKPVAKRQAKARLKALKKKLGI